jgi:WD40 repeat protein
MSWWLCVVLIASTAGGAAAQPPPFPPGGRLFFDQPPRPVPPKPRPPIPVGPVKLDRHGDPLPPGAVARYGTVRLRHGAGPSYLEFTRDGRFLISFGADDTLRTWDPATGREVARPAGEFDMFATLPDGTVLLLRGHRLHLWTPASGQTREVPRELIPPAAEGDDPVPVPGGGRNEVALAAHPDGRTAAVGYATQVHLIDLRTGDRRAVLNLPGPNRVVHLDFSPDGRWLAGSGSKTGVWLWDLRTNRRVRTYRSDANETLAVFNRDGSRLVIAGDDVRVYPTDAEEADPRFEVYDGKVQDVRFSPDGASLLVLEQTGAVARLDAITGEVKDTFPSPDGEITGGGALAPSGLVAAANGPSGVIRLWNPKTGDGPTVVPLPALGSVRLSPDGTATALGEDNKVYTFGATDGRHRSTIELPVDEAEGVSWDPRTGRVVYLTGGDDPELHVLDAATGKLLGKIPYAEKGRPHVAFDPSDPNRVAVFGPGSAVVTNLTTGRPITTVRFGAVPEMLTHGEFSPDGRLLVVATHPLTVYELATGKVRFEIAAANDPRDVIFTTDGRLLGVVTGTDGVVVFDTRGGRVIRRLTANFEGGIYTPAFDATGKWLAAGSRQGEVGVWDLTTGVQARAFSGHDNLVNGVAFTPDGARLVTTSADGTALIWDLTAELPTGEKPPVASADEAFALLGAADPAEAQRGAAFLHSRPADALKLLAEKVPVPKGVGRDTIARLIRELDSPDFKTRTAATRELEAVGGEALHALRGAADQSPSAEVRKAAGSILAKIATGPATPDELRVVRAVEITEHVGTPAAGKLLAVWAAGPPGHRLTTEAAAASARLNKRTQKPEATPTTGATP